MARTPNTKRFKVTRNTTTNSGNDGSKKKQLTENFQTSQALAQSMYLYPFTLIPNQCSHRGTRFAWVLPY
jgi:hypothetical protein